MFAISLTVACSGYIYNGVILHAHAVRGESHNHRNATGEVATPLSYRWPESLSRSDAQYCHHRRKGRHFTGEAEKFALKITICPKNTLFALKLTF